MNRFFSFALLLSASFVFAQQHLPSNYFMQTLPNGLQVLVIEDNSVPLATIEICVKNGSYTEDSAFNGLSHLYEHMFFKANKDIPSQEAYIKRVNQLGIIFNGTTSEERVNYFFTLPISNLDSGLLFMNSAIRYPLFLSQEMKNEDPVVDGEFQRAESNPVFGLSQDFDKHLWGNLYWRKNPIGLHDVILSATAEKMKVIQQKYYWPNNSLLTIAGNVKHDDVFAEVKKIYGDWQPSGFDPFQKWPVPEFAPLTQDEKFVTLSDNARIPIVFEGWHGPDTRNDLKGTYAADLFTTILGLSDSKFQQELVDSGLAYQVQIGYQTAKYTGPLQLVVVPNPQHINECMKKVNELISQFDDAGFITDEQIQTAKTQLAIGHTREGEKTSSMVHTVSFNWATSSLDYYTTYIDNINKVTRADMQSLVRTYIKGKPRVEGVLLSAQMQKAFGITSFDDMLK